MHGRNWMTAIGVVGIVLGLAVGVRLGGAQDDETAKTTNVHLIAVCDTYEVVEQLMASDRFVPRVEEKQQEFAEAMGPMDERLRAMQAELQQMDPEAEGAQQKFQEFQRLRQEIQRLASQKEMEFQAFLAGLLQEAHGLVMDSAAGVAEELGYAYVLSSRSEGNMQEATTTDAVVNSMLGRPVLVSPEGVDITADVIDDLKLD